MFLYAILLAAVTTSSTYTLQIHDLGTNTFSQSTATCLNADLLASCAVAVPGKGVATCQGLLDSGFACRPALYNALVAGTLPPSTSGGILRVAQQQASISSDTGFYKWNGQLLGMYAGTRTLESPAWRVSVTGNVLAGECVIHDTPDRTILSVLESTHSLAVKTLQIMEIVDKLGGDGRCSCDSAAPIRCGCPVPSASSPGHIGAMLFVVAPSDPLPPCNVAVDGCAGGDLNTRLTFKGDGLKSIHNALKHVPEKVDFGLSGPYALGYLVNGFGDRFFLSEAFPYIQCYFFTESTGMYVEKTDCLFVWVAAFDFYTHIVVKSRINEFAERRFAVPQHNTPSKLEL